jgi:Sigma-70, region 4
MLDNDEVVQTLQRMHDARHPKLGTYIVAIRRRGYSLQDIADVLDLSRERIRQIEHNTLRKGDDQVRMLGTPMPAARQGRPSWTPPPTQSFELPVGTQAELIGLWQMSSRVRNATPDSSPYRKASELFDERVTQLVAAGISVATIAREIGIDVAPLRARLHRHGITVEGVRDAG